MGVVVSVLAVMCAWWAYQSVRGGRAGRPAAPSDGSEAKVVVLEDCDPDYKSPPFEDVVRILDSQGRAIRTLSGLNICQTVGGCRAISASEDGTVFVACENVADRLSAYETATGRQIWSLPGHFTSAMMSEGRTYALLGTGTIAGDSVLVIDGKGKIIRQAKLGGFDIAVDPASRALWLVGKDIKKCGLDLQLQVTTTPIAWCAVSVDVAPDGSVWAAERVHPDVQRSQSRLMKVSPAGAIVNTVALGEFDPLCVRVDRTDGSVWATGGVIRRVLAWDRLLRWPPAWSRRYKGVGTRTCKYSAEGQLILTIKTGGESLDLDRSDGSVWIAGKAGLLHYSRQGKKLGTCTGFSAENKWIAIIQTKEEATTPSGEMAEPGPESPPADGPIEDGLGDS